MSNPLAKHEMISGLFGFDLQNQAPSTVQAKVGVEPPVGPNPEPSELFGFELQNQTPSSVQAKVGEPVGVNPEPLAPDAA